MWNWLSVAPKNKTATAGLLLAIACLAVLWIIAWYIVAYTYSIDQHTDDPFSGLPCDQPGVVLAFLVVLQVLLIPWLVVEEVFRLAPLWAAMQLARRSNNRKILEFTTFFMCTITAACFGAVHVEGLGVTLIHALVVQGVLGFLMNLLYLKTGGMSKSPRNNLKAFWITYLFHLMWDWIIFTPLTIYFGYVVFVDPSIHVCE